MNKIFLLFLTSLIITAVSTTKAEAFTPVTYTCCKNFAASDGIQINNFENESEWTGNSQAIDFINFKDGQQGLKLMVRNGAEAYSDLNVNLDLSNINNFSFWVYVDNADNEGSVGLSLTSTVSGGWSKSLYDDISRLKSGWNRIVLNKNSFISSGGESWSNVMKRIRISTTTLWSDTIHSYLPVSFNVTFDDLRYNMAGQKAKLMITFDDGLKNVYTKAYPILSANDQRGVSYVVTSRPEADSADYMNLSDLRLLQSSGWDISSHTVNHANLTTLTDSFLTSELNDSYGWLVANKFQKSAGFLAYPYGALNDNVINKAQQKYILARSIEPQGVQQQYTNEDTSIQYTQRITEVYSYTTVQSVKDNIDDIINSKLLGILVYHGIVDSNPDTYQTLTANFKEISDYIKSKSADIDVITNSDYVISNINNFTPVLNKVTRIDSSGTSILITDNKYDEYMPNMTVKPSSGSIDIGITTYSEDGRIVKFSESSSSSNLQVSYAIGDRIPNETYNVKIYLADGSLYNNFDVIADSAGYIKYDSTGFESARYQELNIVSAPTPTPTPTSPPIANWKFDETTGTIAADSSGNGNTGSLINGPLWTTGKLDNALSFDGLNDYVTASNSSTLDIKGNQITIEAWIYPKSLKEEYIVSKFTGDNVTSGYNFLITSRSFYFRLGDGTTMYQLIQPHGMSVNNWYHVAAVYDGSSMKIYKNGVALTGSTSFTGNIGSNSNNVNIGRNGYGYYLNGNLDEVRIYNRALSAAEILADYNSEKSPTPAPTIIPVPTSTPTPTSAVTFTPTPTLIPDSSQVANWKFDETTGTIAADSSGNGNTGSLINGPLWTTGKLDNALSFDGVNDYVNAGNNSNLNVTGNKLTIEAWVYPKSLKEEYIVSKFTGDKVTSGYNFLITFGRFYFRLGDGTTMYQLIQPHGMSVNNWYHVAAVYDGSSMKIYKNGVALSRSTPFTGNIGSNSNNVNIGRNGYGYYLNGNLDEVRIYNRALSAAEILADYNSER